MSFGNQVSKKAGIELSKVDAMLDEAIGVFHNAKKKLLEVVEKHTAIQAKCDEEIAELAATKQSSSYSVGRAKSMIDKLDDFLK